MNAYKEAIKEDAIAETMKLVADDFDFSQGSKQVDKLVDEWKKVQEAGKTLEDGADKKIKALEGEITK